VAEQPLEVAFTAPPAAADAQPRPKFATCCRSVKTFPGAHKWSRTAHVGPMDQLDLASATSPAEREGG
jgi:hypothetical protein